MIRLAAAAALALAAGPADPLAGRIAGPARQCVDLDRLGGPDVLRDGRIVYRWTQRRWWVTRPVGRCPSLRPLTTLVVEVYGTQLCRNDRFRTAEPGSVVPSPTCRFGDFVPYDLPPR